MTVLSSLSVRRHRRASARRRVTVAALSFVLLALTAAALPQAAAAGAPVRAYRGLGSWVDVYDSRAWDHPAATARDLRANHVRTLYLETAKSSTRAVTIPAALLKPGTRNVIGFVARGGFPTWRTRGVKDVSLSEP